jgi:hypothetical protein
LIIAFGVTLKLDGGVACVVGWVKSVDVVISCYVLSAPFSANRIDAANFARTPARGATVQRAIEGRG